MVQRRRDMFNEWRDLILKIPKNYPTLTEAQWMEAVKYFNGCAICGSESIDTRGYFIPFKSGGRYCDWNVIPMCEKCATNAKTTPGYFLVSRPVDMLKIVDYLEERIDAALRRDAEAK